MGLYPRGRSSSDKQHQKVIATPGVRHECEFGDSCGARVGTRVGHDPSPTQHTRPPPPWRTPTLSSSRGSGCSDCATGRRFYLSTGSHPPADVALSVGESASPYPPFWREGGRCCAGGQGRCNERKGTPLTHCKRSIRACENIRSVHDAQNGWGHGPSGVP
jgi:hypothetical protein